LKNNRELQVMLAIYFYEIRVYCFETNLGT
jgi:hypothetical protein